MIIQYNRMAGAINRIQGIVEKNRSKSLEKLNSGYRINRAADDAAGLAITEEMRGQIRGLNQAVRNVKDGIGYVQTADAALSEIDSILHRMEELAVQAANDTNTEADRRFIDMEVQMLKDEMDRIFEDTEYNTLKIWDTRTNDREQIGTRRAQALTMGTYGNSFYVNETNKGAVAYSPGYKIEVQGTDENDPATYGFRVTWTGWNQRPYTTELVPWSDVGTGAFEMRISDYFGTSAPPEIAGIDFRLGWSTADAEVVTVEDVAAAIDGRIFGSGISSSEQTTNNQTAPGVSYSVNTNYLAELACDRNTEHADTVWIEPMMTGTTNVQPQPSYTDPREDSSWNIHFTMPNIGPVTAKVSSISYYGNDQRQEKEGIFWRWYGATVNGVYVPHYSKGQITHYPSQGTSGSLHALTDCSSNTLDIDSLQNSQGGGVININFNMTPDSGTVNYEGRTGTSVGTITIQISVSQSDDEAAVMRKIQAALNPNTRFDVLRNDRSYTSHSIYSTSANQRFVEIPLYKALHTLHVQAGANAGQLIGISYESLRVLSLGMHNTNVLNRASASAAISEVRSAAQVVAEQRSLFGAYQNRFDHAYDVNAGTAENLQASESNIRDANMADEMVRYSAANILSEAGQAMLAQVNRLPEGILQLLR